MYLVADASGITPDTLNNLFESSGAGLPTVTEVRSTPLDGGYGYLSRLFRLELEWSGKGAKDAPLTLVAKLPLQARLDAMTPDAVRMFRREAMFHQVVAPNAPLQTAKTWVAEFDNESGAATMVFEDLGKLDSFSDSDTISVERVENALIAIAALHARYWQSNELETMDWLAHPAKTGVDQVSSERFAMLWPRLVESGAYELSSTQRRLGELLSTKLDGVYEVLHTGPKSLIHADLHQENLFFDRNTPTFIDWALAERANPAKDVAKLTAACLEPGTIGKEQPRLIRRYREQVTTRIAALRQAQDGSPPKHTVIPTRGTRLRVEGSDRSSKVTREILNQVQNDKHQLRSWQRQNDEPELDPVHLVSLDDLERDVLLATCHYLASMTFLSDRNFASLAASPETRTDFTSSRVVAACDRDGIVAAVEAI